LFLDNVTGAPADLAARRSAKKLFNEVLLLAATPGSSTVHSVAVVATTDYGLVALAQTLSTPSCLQRSVDTKARAAAHALGEAIRADESANSPPPPVMFNGTVEVPFGGSHIRGHVMWWIHYVILGIDLKADSALLEDVGLLMREDRLLDPLGPLEKCAPMKAPAGLFAAVRMGAHRARRALVRCVRTPAPPPVRPPQLA